MCLGSKNVDLCLPEQYRWLREVHHVQCKLEGYTPSDKNLNKTKNISFKKQMFQMSQILKIMKFCLEYMLKKIN